MSARQCVMARRRFGARVVVEKRPSLRFPPGGRLGGKCSTCLRAGCRRANTMTIGTHELGGQMFLILGRGHSWKEAWSRAELEFERRGGVL